jgi:hypothetical protein
MAREAGGRAQQNKNCDVEYLMSADALKAFEALVRADEREQAIALQQHEDVLAPIGHSAWGEAYQEGWAEGTAAYRDAIRARGNT